MRACAVVVVVVVALASASLLSAVADVDVVVVDSEPAGRAREEDRFRSGRTGVDVSCTKIMAPK